MKFSEFTGYHVCQGRVVKIEPNTYWTEISQTHFPTVDSLGVRILLAVDRIDGEPVENDEAVHDIHSNIMFLEVYACACRPEVDENNRICLLNRTPRGAEIQLGIGDTVSLSGEITRKALRNGTFLRLENREPLFGIKKACFYPPSLEVAVDTEEQPCELQSVG